MSEIADTLNRAAELIEPEGKWAQFDYAFNASGLRVNSLAEDAVCWCAMGAIRKSAKGFEEAQNAFNFLASIVGPVSAFNDTEGRTQAEVVEALRQAAKAAA